MTSSSDLRAVAEQRRRAASEAGDRGGDAAYAAFRAAVPGVGQARRVPTKTGIRAQTERRDGKDSVHTSGYFTRYGIAYPMWDAYGEYHERVMKGAGSRTIAAKPDVAFLVNHGGVTMARTTSGSLVLEERDAGGWHDAWLNPKRQDVADLREAINDGDVDQMSFAFMIPEGSGEWSEDFTEFEIRAYDLDRGDVSAVNYGASPYTDISARSAEILQDLDRLPAGAARAAADRLVRRGFALPGSQGARESITVHQRVEPVVVTTRSVGSSAVRRLSSLRSTTVARLIAEERRGRSIRDLAAEGLPWYEVRNADGGSPEPGEDPDTATVFVYDDIGGSMGVNAKTFAMELEEITAPNISLRINSPGGSVFDAIAIHSSLLHHPATVTSYVDGYAASAASVVMMAADLYDPATGKGGVHVMPGAQIMVHKASMNTQGNDDDHEKAIGFLRRQSENIAGMYAAKAGGTVEEWMEVMTAETWMFGPEAVEQGLADAVVERPKPVGDEEMAERMARTHDLTGRYRYTGRRTAPAPGETRAAIRSRLATRGAAAADERPPFDAQRVMETLDESAADPSETRSSGSEATGRSIALIEAQLKASEA